MWSWVCYNIEQQLNQTCAQTWSEQLQALSWAACKLQMGWGMQNTIRWWVLDTKNCFSVWMTLYMAASIMLVMQGILQNVPATQILQYCMSLQANQLNNILTINISFLSANMSRLFWWSVTSHPQPPTTSPLSMTFQTFVTDLDKLGWGGVQGQVEGSG